MYSPQPAEQGETPTKIVFENVAVDTDPAKLQRLYVANLGTIAAFQSKARQQRLLSDNPTASMQEALPNGQRMRAVYNNGQETLYVTLTPEDLAESPETPQPQPGQPCDVLLAIDVLFDPAQFQAGDIFTHDQVATTSDDYRTWDRVPFTPQPPVQIAAQYPKNVGYAVADNSHLGSTTYDDGSQNFDSIAGRTILYGDDAKVYGAIRNAVGNPTSYQQLQFDLSNAGIGSATLEETNQRTEDNGYSAFPGIAGATSPVGSTWAIVFAVVGTSFNYPQGMPIGEYDVNFTYYAQIEYYARPSSTPIVHEEIRQHLDILPVVGLRIAPTAAGGAEHTALSAGDHSGETDALRCIADNDQTQVTRQIAFTDPAGGKHFVGAGFTAKVTLPPGQAGSKTEIEVYLASCNVEQSNPSPGQTDSAYGVDAPDMTWATTKNLTYHIQVREMLNTSAAPYVVRVSVDAGGTIERRTTGEETTTTDEPAAVHLDWRFTAATKKWADGGNEPADPAAKDVDGNPSMGKLLAHTDNDQLVQVVSTTALARALLTQPAWTGPVTGMTKVSTITWTPPSSCEVHGTATIADVGTGSTGSPGLGTPTMIQ